MAAVAGSSRKSSVAVANNSMSPSSSTKPRSAKAMAGAISAPRGRVPYFARAYSSPATLPGTPTAKWPFVLAPLMTLPALSRNIPCFIPASYHLEQPRSAHSAADAHRRHDILHTAALAFDQCMRGKPRARHAVGVADRDRSTVDVQPIVGDAELIATVDHLHC